MDGGKAFIELRDRLLRDGITPEEAERAFQWPHPGHFNWARDYFDRIAAGNEKSALRLVDDAGLDETLTFSALARRSDQVANWLEDQGILPGDRLLLMLGNVAALWETMLAAIKLGAVIIPTTTLLQRADLEDRLTRGRVRAVLADHARAAEFEGLQGAPLRVAVGGEFRGWRRFSESHEADPLPRIRAPTPADAPDPLRLSVPKAFVVPAPGVLADADTARSILDYVRDRVSPFKRIRRIEFCDLPKTISGKIRRVDLRLAERDREPDCARRRHEFWEEDLGGRTP